MTREQARERAELAHWEKHVSSSVPSYRRPDIFFAGRASLEPLVQQLVDALPRDCCGLAYAERIKTGFAAAREQGFVPSEEARQG